mgnify:CR=1 FL=1
MSKPIRAQFADTMLAVGQEDPRLVVLVGDISHFALQPFAEACPGRYYNVGICEPTIVSMAAGVARSGLLPVAHTIAPFLIERSLEQIKLDFCYHRLPGNLVTVGSAFDYSNLGCTHHCTNDFALLKTLDRAQITYPASCAEFDALFRAAYANDCLTLYRVPGRDHGVDFAPGDIEFGRGIVVRPGTDLTIVATGPHLRTALDAVDGLHGLGYDAEIVYIHTIRPLDTELLRASIGRTRRAVVIEEHVQSGGLGDDVLRCTHDLGGIGFASLSIGDRFVRRYGSYDDHLAALGLTVEGLLRLVRERFGERS